MPPEISLLFLHLYKKQHTWTCKARAKFSKSMFTTKAATWGARTGCLAINGKEIATPNFIIATTRGAVPHLTPDHSPNIPVVGVYAEEFWDQSGLLTTGIDRFSLPFRSVLVMGSCRKPESRMITNKPNSTECFGIDTVQGSRLASVDTMIQFMKTLKADVFLVPYDIPSQSLGDTVGRNRVLKMEQRSLNWLDKFWHNKPCDSLIVATIPMELYNSEYMNHINDKCDAYCFVNFRSANLDKSTKFGDPTKLRISSKFTTSWSEVIREIAFGEDLIHIPLNIFAEEGLALTLQWNASTPEYLDLKDDIHTLNTRNLGDTGHSIAYIHHLLEAQEMTAQVLLQLYNYDVVTKLFDDVRKSIANGQFVTDLENFVSVYK